MRCLEAVDESAGCQEWGEAALTETKSVLAIDVGGTNIVIAVVSGEGEITARTKMHTDCTSSDALTTQLITGIESMRANCDDDVAAIGIGVPGVVDADTGTVVQAANIPLSGVRAERILSEACKLPVTLGNDATLGTTGEAWYGAVREMDVVAGVFVGTGIGGGLVIDGRPFGGSHGAAGEFGYLFVNVDGKPTPLEYVASRTAVSEAVQRAVEGGSESVLAVRLAEMKQIRSKHLRSALDAGDMVTTVAVEDACRWIGQGIASLLHLLDPNAVVLGGGMVQACGDFMMPRIKDAAEALMLDMPGDPTAIVQSELGDDAVVLGAAALAQEAVAAGRPGGPRAYTPQIDWIGEGEVQVNGKRYVQDIIVRADGSVKKRGKKISVKAHGSGHLVGVEEVKSVCRGEPRKLIVGNGSEELLEVGPDAVKWLKKQGIVLIYKSSPQAIEDYRLSRGPRALLLHVRH
jgi:glucokinase